MMNTKKTITLSHIDYTGKDYIRIDFAFDKKIINLIKKFGKVKWSMKNRSWIFHNENDNLNSIISIFEEVAKVIYIPADKKHDIKRIEEHTNFMSNPFSEYSSLFISYSFVDKDFVHRLNDSLRNSGVNTFLWEKDAPFGETLKNIMYENVHQYDRVLFVASENSIKSPACQYELSQARHRQDKLWKTILFPIHIDSFLFEISKENIRPREMIEEYWKNIGELREINSLDFTDIVDLPDDDKRFKNKINILLKNLKND